MNHTMDNIYILRRREKEWEKQKYPLPKWNSENKNFPKILYFFTTFFSPPLAAPFLSVSFFFWSAFLFIKRMELSFVQRSEGWMELFDLKGENRSRWKLMEEKGDKKTENPTLWRKNFIAFLVSFETKFRVIQTKE